MPSTTQNGSETMPRKDWTPWLDAGALLATFLMTFLTIAKEKVLYQNEAYGWKSLVYWLAVNPYYTLFAINLGGLIWLMRQRLAQKRHAVLLGIALAVVLINAALFSANNVINLFSGRPVHGWHKGIGW